MLLRPSCEANGHLMETVHPSSTSRLRVTIVSPYGTLGGAELWLLRLLDATDRLDVDVLQLGRGPLVAELAQRGIPTNFVDTGSSVSAMVRAALRVHARLRREPPDVILANGLKGAIVGGLAARALGIPIVWAKHDHFHDHTVGRLVARLVDLVVATSPDLAAATHRRDTLVLPPPRRSTPPFSRDAARRRLSEVGVELTDEPTLVMLGRIISYKGIDDAILALGQVPTWRLIVLGAEDPAEPGTTARLMTLAASIGVADRVSFAGHVADAGDLLAAFDSLAMLTKLDHELSGEGFGISALEAVLAGVPVVATRGAPVLRLLGEAAITVAPGDPAGVAGALELIRDRASAARDMAAALARSHPDERATADQFVATLAATACRPGAARTGGPPVSIITTVFNEADTIDPLLDRLLRQLAPDDELIVVDGGSTDATVELLERRCRSDPKVRVIVSPGATIADGRNLAIVAAIHEVIACTDSGCEPAPTWLQGIRAAFAEPDAASLITGVYQVTGNSAFQQAMAAANYPNLAEAARRGPLVRAYGRLFGTLFDATLPTGRAMAFSRLAIERVGRFPETLSEVVVGQAIAADGGRCQLSTDVCVSWQQRSSWRATARMYWNYGYGDGVSGSPKLIGRNLTRALAVIVICLAAFGRLPMTVRLLTVLSGVAYTSLPIARARRMRLPARATALIPAAIATKTLAKAAGCIAAMAMRAWSRAAHQTHANYAA